jgi:hypothetical protein
MILINRLNELRHEIREKQLGLKKTKPRKIEETEKLIEKFLPKASKASMAIFN